MEEDADIVPSAGWFRLAAAVVRGLPADDPQREEWRDFGLDLVRRLTPAHQVTRVRPALVSTITVATLPASVGSALT